MEQLLQDYKLVIEGECILGMEKCSFYRVLDSKGLFSSIPHTQIKRYIIF